MGYGFGDFRLESEFVYQENNSDKYKYTYIIPDEYSHIEIIEADGDISNLTLFFNGYYNFLKGRTLQPYVTGGVGLARVEALGHDDIVFAYQISEGIGYDMTENIALDLRYRYLGTSDPHLGPSLPSLGPPPHMEYSSHSVCIGLRFYF